MYEVEITLSSGKAVRKVFTFEDQALEAAKRAEEMCPGLMVRVNYLG